MTEHEAQERLRKLDEWRLGQFGEAVWSNVLKPSGLRYIPLCQIANGGAPMVEAKRGGDALILPDFEVIGDGFDVYFDSKAKTQSVIYRAAKQERHGIDGRNYQHYLRVADATGRKAGLGIVELYRDCGPLKPREWSGALLVETLGNLRTPIMGFSNQEHMLYWTRKSFHELDTLTAIELLDVANGKKCPGYPVQLSAIFRSVPRKQQDLF